MQFIQVQAYYRPELALESIIDIKDKSFGSMVSSIANYFPSLRQTFAGAADHLSNLKEVPKEILSSLSNAFSMKDIPEGNFQDYSRVNVVVPESFTGNLYEYGDFLSRSWSFLQLNAIPQLDKFYATLASFASNKESKISLIDTSAEYKTILAQYEALVNESKAYFGSVRHNSTKSKLGDAFGDFDQFKKAETFARELSKQLSSREVSKILDRVKKISGVLDIVIQDAQAKEYNKASYEAVKSLANATYTLAEIVSFYSVTYYRIIDYSKAMSENKNVLKKL